MSFHTLSVERSGRIAVVRIDRDDGINGISLEMMRELRSVALGFEEDHETSAVVLTGTSRVFSCGFDLKDAEQMDLPLARDRQVTKLGARMCRAWEEIDPVTFVAIEGWCIGGGLALALTGDMRVAGETATLYVPELERGFNLSWETVPRLVSLVGPSRTKRIVLLAERIAARRGLEMGLVDEVAPAGGAFDVALAMAKRVAALPPIQVRMCKEAISVAAGALGRATSFADTDQSCLAVRTRDSEEAIRAFMEKRTPEFSGE